jgi:hypothetical protein
VGPAATRHAYPGEAERSLALIARYQRTLSANRAKLRLAVKALARLGCTRVVVWGAGRLFDGLVRFGGLNPGRLSGIVDAHLGMYVESVHGRPVVDPARLPALQPDLVVIASRAYAEEIRRAAEALVPGCTIVGFNELLEVPDHVAAGRG